MNTRIAKRTLLTLPLLGALALGACSDDPVAVDDDHAEPAGVVITMSGQTMATYDAATGWSGELGVVAGAETPHLDVTFVDEDGDAIPLDADTYLEVEIGDVNIAGWEQDTPGEFGGHLQGVSQGTTTAVFRLMHGSVGSGHADFVTTTAVVEVL